MFFGGSFLVTMVGILGGVYEGFSYTAMLEDL